MLTTWKMDRSPKDYIKGGKLFALLVATLLVGLSSVALAEVPGPGFGHHMMGHGWGGSGMIIGPLVMIAVLAVVVVTVVLIVRWLGVGHPLAGTHRLENTALDILRKRFARGEIDKDEFDERRRILEG